MSNRPRPPAEASVGFFLLIGWFALENGWRPLAAVLAAAVLHELGHLLMLKGMGAQVSGFCLRVFGAEIRADRSRLSYGEELLVLLAGPAMNLIWGWGLSACAHGRTGMELAAGAHLLLGAFNLLPVRLLDGGQALRTMLCWRWDPNVAEQICRAANLLSVGCVTGGLALVMLRTGGSLWLLGAVAAVLCAALPKPETDW